MSQQQIAAQRSLKRRNQFRRNLPLYLMLLLPVLLLFIYNYIPMAGIVIAFQKFLPAKGVLGSKWVGLQNFKTLFGMPGFGRALCNTLTLSVWKIVLGVVVPVAFTLLLNELGSSGFKRTVQTMIYLPHFISWSVAGGLVYMLLSPNTGVVNNVIKMLGGTPKNFLGQSQYFYNIVLFSGMWKNLGWGSIVYLAAITGIDDQLYEAAYIDGAGRLKRIWHVTLPGIRTCIAVMLILEVGNFLSISFNQIFALINKAVLDKGETLDYFVYRMGLNSSNNFSVATATGLIKSLVGLVMIFATNKAAKKLTDGEGGIW